MCTKNQIWGTVPEIWSMTESTFCHFGPYFALLPPNNPENQNIEKMENMPGHILILHMCNINKNQMILVPKKWSMTDKFFVILDCFCPFIPLTTKKIYILKKWKNHLGISSFYFCEPQMTIIWCVVPEIWRMMDIIFCHFGPFFALLHL